MAAPMYIKDAAGVKVSGKVTSVNITAEQDAFLKVHHINLSGLVREAIEAARGRIEGKTRRHK